MTKVRAEKCENCLEVRAEKCENCLEVRAEYTPKILRKDEAIDLVRRYKEVIAPRFDRGTKVMMFGSYSKGHPHEWSDIDVAVIVPKIADGKWLDWSTSLWHDVKQVSLLIEPVLMEQDDPSPLYRDVMRTGVIV